MVISGGARGGGAMDSSSIILRITARGGPAGASQGRWFNSGAFGTRDSSGGVAT